MNTPAKRTFAAIQRGGFFKVHIHSFAWLAPAEATEPENPYDTDEYQQFVASMAQHCHCRANNCPCDGVLAGGPCDMIQEEEPWPSYDDDE